MSIEVSAYVWKNSKQSGTRLLLLVAIADYTNAEGWAWPSIASLCQRTRMGERYVQKMIREIADEGELEIRARKNASNFYRIPMVNHSSPLPPGASTGEPGFVEGVNSGSPKPSLEPLIEPSLPLSPQGGGGDTSIETKRTGFDEFWAAYPKKEKKDKALAAWIRKGCAKIREEIMLALAIQKTSAKWVKKGGQFIPYPTTWINGGEWQNEVQETPQDKPAVTKKGW